MLNIYLYSVSSISLIILYVAGYVLFDALLRFLFAHTTKPEFQVRWRWQQDDVAIWDNGVTQHYANADYLPQRRIMHRATVLGDKPVYRP